MTLLEALVVQGSYTKDVAGGTAVADLLVAALETIDGLEVTRHPSDTFAPHLTVRSRAAQADGSGCVALVGHYDTVFPPGTFEGFVLEEGDSGRLARGPGVLDMKGGLAVVVTALSVLADEGVLARLPLRAAIVSDEEVGSPESFELTQRELGGAACALVFEAGRQGDAIITARKGTGQIVARAHGKASHAGNQHREGANAVWALCKLVDQAQALTDYERGVTVSVGTIAGGHSRNVVPDRAEAMFDLRFVHDSDGEALVEAFHRVAIDAAAAVPGTRIDIEGGVKRPPLERSDANVALFGEYAACAAAAGLGSGECALVGGGSDASTTGAIGIPSIDGLGPRGRGFHTHDEYIEVDSLDQRLEALVRFLWARAGDRAD